MTPRSIRITLTDDEHRWLKLRAATHDEPMTAFAARAIRQAIAAEQGATGTPPPTDDHPPAPPVTDGAWLALLEQAGL